MGHSFQDITGACVRVCYPFIVSYMYISFLYFLFCHKFVIFYFNHKYISIQLYKYQYLQNLYSYIHLAYNVYSYTVK